MRNDEILIRISRDARKKLMHYKTEKDYKSMSEVIENEIPDIFDVSRHPRKRKNENFW